MGLWQSFKGLTVVHLLMFYTFLTSGLLISFLMAVGMIIWPFNKNLYRRYAFCLAYGLWSQLTFVTNWWSESKCDLYIDPEDHKYLGKEHTMIVINHNYELDWLMTWMVAERHGMLGNTKLYSKGILKFVPILGWSWYFTESIFLKRNWAEDKKLLAKSASELATYPDDLRVMYVFCPEGTRCTPEKFAASQKFAREKGYPEYKHMLLPRAKGFALLIKEMKGKLPSIMDVTVGFSEPVPTLMDPLRGKQMQAAVKVKRYELKDIPCETDEEAGVWLRELFRRKDEDLDMYMKTGKFDGPPVKNAPRRYYDLVLFIFWSLLTLPLLFYYLFYLVFMASLFHTACVVLVVVFAVLMAQWMVGFSYKKHASSYGKSA